MILIGEGKSFVYSSHQYYGVSGRKNRSGPMAVHEILISIGYGSGAIVGGYLAEYLSRYAPYGFGLGAVLIALSIQIFIFLAHKKHQCTHF
jgi:predicted MFS family arabinose efflux permease